MILKRSARNESEVHMLTIILYSHHGHGITAKNSIQGSSYLYEQMLQILLTLNDLVNSKVILLLSIYILV